MGLRSRLVCAILSFATLTAMTLTAVTDTTAQPAMPAQTGSATTPTASQRPARVLFLNSYHQGYEWSDSITTGVMAVFKQIEPSVGVYVEYLDTIHFGFPDERKTSILKDFSEKYPKDFFDLVIASDDRAFEFMKQYRDTLFPGKPVVFAGVNYLDETQTPLPPGFTGIVESFDYEGLLAMVRAIFPERKRATIIVDNSITAEQIIRSASAVFPTADGFTAEFLRGSDFSHEELFQRLMRLGPDQFVIIGLWQRDRMNEYMTVTDAFSRIAASSTAPAFVVLRTSPTVGIAGGSAVSGVHQGRTAARMAIDILHGKRPSDIPVSRECAFDRMLNRAVLESRWGIKWDSLPPEIRAIPPIFPLERNYQLPRELLLTDGETAFIRSGPEIHIVLRDAPPLMIPGDPPSGLVVDLITEMSAMNGMKVKYDTLEGNNIRCSASHAANGVGGTPRPLHVYAARTAAPTDKFIFTEPYAWLNSVIFTRDDTEFIGSLAALNGKRAAVLSDTHLLTIMKEQYPGVRLTVFHTAREAIQAVDDRKVDAWVGFLATGMWLKRELGLSHVVNAAPTNLPPQPMSLAIPKDQPILAEILNKSIALLPPDRGETLKDAYMDRMIVRQGWSTDTVLKLLLGVASGFLVVVSILALRIRSRSRQLKLRERNLQVTLDSIGDAVIVTDAALKVIRMNPVAEKLTGWSLDDARDREIAQVMRLADPETNESVSNPAESVRSGIERDHGRGDRALLISRQNHTCLIEETAAPMGRSGDSGVVIVFRDVTQRQMYQDQIQHSRKMEAIGQLAGGVAHDFNNMLAAIQGYAELLNRKVPEESPERTYIQRIFNATERAAGLTSKLLAFARKGKALSTPIDVHDSIRNALGLLERSIDKTIVISSDLKATSSRIIGDPSQIQSAVLNLCINARDAMPNGGRLEVFTDNVTLTEQDCKNSEFKISPGEYVVIHVKDTGTGIPKDAVDHIFEPFFTTKEVGRGTGLGLAAVHGAIVEHGGAVRFYTEIGKGTQFNVYLPVSHEEVLKPREEYVTHAHHEGLVLLVEDEPIISSMAEAMLVEQGFEVLTAENGRVGLELFKKNSNLLKLVILDVIMPEMDGMTALRLMKEIRADVPFIIASGFSFEHRRDEFMKAGASAFLGKPFRNSELIRTIDECLGKV